MNDTTEEKNSEAMWIRKRIPWIVWACSNCNTEFDEDLEYIYMTNAYKKKLPRFCPECGKAMGNPED